MTHSPQTFYDARIAFLLDKLFDEQAILFSLLEGLLVGVVGGRDEEVVDLVFAVGQAHLRLVLDDVFHLENLQIFCHDAIALK